MQYRRRVLKSPVASLMPPAVVDRFEFVEVDEYAAEVPSSCGVGLYKVFQGFVEATPVGGAGQVIGGASSVLDVQRCCDEEYRSCRPDEDKPVDEGLPDRSDDDGQWVGQEREHDPCVGFPAP